MNYDSLVNRGDFFSPHYLSAVVDKDLKGLFDRWNEVESKHAETPRTRLLPATRELLSLRAEAAEGSRDALGGFHTQLATALGYEVRRDTLSLIRNEADAGKVDVLAAVETSTGLHLVILETSIANDVDEVVSTSGDALTDGRLLSPMVTPAGDLDAPADAVAQLFAVDEPPRFVLVLAGGWVVLADRTKWAEGRFLAADFSIAAERNDRKAKGELASLAALFSADSLIPFDGQVTIDELAGNSHKHAVGVSKELRHGIRRSVEILANEVIQQRLANRMGVYEGANAVDAAELTRQCLRYLFRLLVLFYAEAHPELGILPANDPAYGEGYGLDRLRELALVQMDEESTRTGTHLDQSLNHLFELTNNGNHADGAQLALVDEAAEGRSTEAYLLFPGLEAELFGPDATPLLDGVPLRNEALQQVLQLLMITKEKGGSDRGFISYAELGINQIGAVYEGLMAYSGFFATEDLYEVAKHGDPEKGTWVLPIADADDYHDDVFVTEVDSETGDAERIRHRKGEFVFRLSGRDRQRSASYYTPEVLTRCVVKHALAELLGLDDYAPENGSSGITEAVQMLNLTICEPALGSGAFANEAINQLSTEYLRRRQAELGESLDPDRYQLELQKVKAHFALHQTYGVDLNATAIELAEVSLWLNAMYPGLKAPWFGVQLRRGNSLIGCRRSTWRAGQLGDRPWAQTGKGRVQPAVDRNLSDGPLDDDEIHHFLLPGHGWAAVADRKEAKELRPNQAKELKDWRRKMLAGPKKPDARRLTALAAAVETAWRSGAERIRLAQQSLRRPIDVYGVADSGRRSTTSRQQVENALHDPNSALGCLRTLMDAWVGLWFWPLDAETQPPTWEQWLRVAEELVRPDERNGPSGQLDLFDDLADLVEAEEELTKVHALVAGLRDRHPWLAVAVDAARREGAWHWELEFAPVFEQGGFDLQVGNPPWVRLDWKEDLTLAEFDPWWGATDKAPAKEQKSRRELNLAGPGNQAGYLAELASAEGVVEILGSPVLRPGLAGIRTNLYMVFMDTVWRHLRDRGAAGLLHPESHFTDPRGAVLRRTAYRHLRRHWQFVNELMLFEDIGHPVTYGIHVYGDERQPAFVQIGALLHPHTADQSLAHSGEGTSPGIQYPEGGWDLRPHKARVLTITEGVLAGWARLFDEPGTPSAAARLLRPVTTADLESLAVLSDQPVRLADHAYHWTQGWNETNAKADGIIRWETAVPDSWDEVILQGPHFTIATPLAKQPNENCRSKGDYSEWDLESLAESLVPRTNYQRACDRDTYTANLDHWGGERSTTHWRLIWRAMTQPGGERSLRSAILHPGPAHIGGAFALSFESTSVLVLAAGLWSTLPLDYLVKVAGVVNVKEFLVNKLPQPSVDEWLGPLVIRTLRLNCLTVDYAPLWDELWSAAWQQDRWTDLAFGRVTLGDVGRQWSMSTPLRRDFERRLALVELDALSALALGLTSEQLCAMYRTQFAVLRKYECKMAFDAEGRKLCGYHQSAGYRQSELQDQAKAGDLPAEWKSVWKLYEQYEDDPSSVDWLGHYTPPFTRPDREAEMTRAYNEFQRRLEAGEYGERT